MVQCDNGDNGTYEIDLAKMEIVGRKFHRGREQKEHDSEAMAKGIISRIDATDVVI